MIQILEDFSLFTDTPTPVSVEAYADNFTYSDRVNGLRLTVNWLDCTLVTEISHLNRDNDTMNFYFYSQPDQSQPDLALVHASDKFQIESVRVLMRTLVQISKHKIDIVEVQDERFFRGTVIEHIESSSQYPSPKLQRPKLSRNAVTL